MFKYFLRTLLGGVLVVGLYNNQIFLGNIKSSKGIYYDNFEYTDNVVLNNTEGTNVDYTGSLQNVGDYYEIIFDVVNDSGVDVLVGDYYCPEDDSYINYEFMYSNGNKINEGDVLKKGESVRLKYKVSYVNLVLDDSYEFDSSFSINYEQKI